MLPTHLCTPTLQNQAELLFSDLAEVMASESEAPSLPENSYSLFKTQIKYLISLHLCLPLSPRQSCGSLSGFPQTCPLEAFGRQNQEPDLQVTRSIQSRVRSRGHRRNRRGGRGTHKDMCKISLVSGFQTPRSSCSKLDMRATPEPTKQGASERTRRPQLPSWLHSPGSRLSAPGVLSRGTMSLGV